MADGHRRRGYVPEDEDSTESTARVASPSARRSGPSHPTVAYYRPRGYNPPSGRPKPGYGGGGAGYDNEDGELEMQMQQEYGLRAGASNDNPLYEVDDEESQFPDPASPSRQGNPNINPLYGNDPFRPSSTTAAAAAAVCMTEFLRPKSPSSPTTTSGYSHSLRAGPQHNPRQEDSGDFIFTDESSDDEDDEGGDYEDAAHSSNRRPSPPVRCPPPRRGAGKGLFSRAPRGEQMVTRYPPARFSPVLPPPCAGRDPSQLVCSPKGKRLKHGATTSSGSRSPMAQPQFCAPNIGDLIAAVRSDKNLLLGEVRKHANREPRVPGDHDRYFAPRKGDIIIHFSPSLDDNKLLEYYDERRSMLRLQPGDKLVRVKYDNYKLPDHLMITSKLYLYAPEWVYLGKALQTIKTA